MTDAEKKELNARLSILVRQLRGVQAMIDTDRPAVEILAQLRSLSGGLAGVRRAAVLMLLQQAMPDNDPQAQREEDRFRAAVAKYLD
jgi:DNA-binding FrmR family transcriptional regulator